MGELEGKPIVVTGAGRGLGRAYALAIAEAGGLLLLNDRDESSVQAVADEIRTRGGKVETSNHAIGTVEAGDAIVGLCVEKFGSIYGLINNAAVHANCLSVEERPANVERIVDVNILGTWYTGVAALRCMFAANAGVIVNIVSGAMLGIAGQAIYAATKGAILSLTTSWAKECEHTNVRVLGISPWARTPMLLANPTDLWAEHGPEVAAPLAVYLLSDRAQKLHGRIVRTAEGQISLYEQGKYGPVLGQRLDWTVGMLDEVLGHLGTSQVEGFKPTTANR